MRAFAAILGLVFLLVAWAGPLPKAAVYSFSSHMWMHMLVIAIAAPLLASGLTPSIENFLGRIPFLLGPMSAALAEFIVVWSWHSPNLHQFARHSLIGLLLEQGMFLFVGLWLWVTSLSTHHKFSGIISLLLTSMHMTLLGALISFSNRPLFAHLSKDHTSSLEDQQLGGAIMLILGGIVYLSGGVWNTSQFLTSPNLEKP